MDKSFISIRWILDQIASVFPTAPRDLSKRHAITLNPTGNIELLIWFENEFWPVMLGPDVGVPEIPELLEHIKVGFIDEIQQRLASKQFMVFRVSSNANSFGLHGHWLMSRDGECWEVARNRTGPHAGEWNKGDIVTIHKLSKAIDDYDWAGADCEIPERKPKAPPHVVAEVFASFPSKSSKPSTKTLTTK
jgi:hypothetical protein